MSDRDAMLAAIHATPEDDTPRLVYADWLDEQPETKPCPGLGCGNPAPAWSAFYRCVTCKGKSFVTDTEDRDRAELIRLQHEIWTTWPALRNYRDHHAVEANADWFRLKTRERELLAAYPQWARAVCRECGNPDVRPFNRLDGGLCSTCYNMGDLLRMPALEVFPLPRQRELTWRCGFVDGVSCRFNGVFVLGRWPYPNTKAMWWPTPWARAVVRALPLTRLAITDRKPSPRYNDPGFVWIKGSELPPHNIPDFLFDGLPEERNWRDRITKWYPTEAAALDALAVAACAEVRRMISKHMAFQVAPDAIDTPGSPTSGRAGRG